MESQQREYIRKVKLKLIQPKIMCSGRNAVTCTFRGKVVFEHGNFTCIKIRSHGEEKLVIFEGDTCITIGFEDLKIV